MIHVTIKFLVFSETAQCMNGKINNFRVGNVFDTCVDLGHETQARWLRAKARSKG